MKGIVDIMRKAFICPTKYVQGEDEILNLGYFVKPSAIPHCSLHIRMM